MKTPVIVGVGQYCERSPDPENLRSALDLAEIASKQAIVDANARDDIAQAIDTVAWVRTFADSAPQFQSQFGFSNNPPRSLANRISANPNHVIHSPVGGNVPQELVNEMSLNIASGDTGMALLSGGEAIANEIFAIKNGLSPNWTEDVDGQCDNRDLGIDALATDYEVAHGVLNFAPLTYSLFENVARHQQGHTMAEHRASMADLMRPFVETAGNNPFSMFSSLPDAAVLRSEDAPVTSLYTKHFCAREKVNQAAALIITSTDKAREMGIDESRWIYPLGGSEATEKTLLARRNLASSEALSIACKSLLKLLDLQPGDLDYLDLYSCFPSAVRAAMEALAIEPDDKRPLTLTGGLPYFGGPGNNYSMHAIAEMVERLRKDQQAIGLISANGGILSKHAIGAYSAKAPTTPFKLADKLNIQQEVDRIPSPKIDDLTSGPARIETCAVSYSRGKPSQALVIARTAEEGHRCVAVVDNADEITLQVLADDNAIGRQGHVQSTGKINIFSLGE